MKFFLFIIGSLLLLSSCHSPNSFTKNKWENDRISIEQLSPHTFVHTSFLNFAPYGKVPCNGMIVVDENEAIIFDTPAEDEDAQTLINYVERELKAKVLAVIPTHFHEDCLGSLDVFHVQKIPSYAHRKTIELCKGKDIEMPQQSFDANKDFHVGTLKIKTSFLGAGHTLDNIVAFVEKDNVLFGGCLVKELNADKGNLADADTTAWSNTIQKVKDNFSNKHLIVIPGHGKVGNEALLDYTYQLFQP